MKPNPAWLVVFIVFAACTGPRESSDGAMESAASIESPVAADILFLVLGKMALYDQRPDGELVLRDHHFVAEIMPREGREVVSGTLTGGQDPEMALEFESEGRAWLAHGARVMDPTELHRLHSDGTYYFSYQTQSGTMEAQPIELAKRTNIDEMPAAFPVTLSQGGAIATPGEVDPDTELLVSWEPLVVMTRSTTSELDDLIFVLGFDCFGNNVFHSGRPYQGGPYLTYRDASTVITPSSLMPGLRYTLVVEQATADVQRFEGVPGIATYASLTFLEFQTSGEPEAQSCPAAR